VACDIVCLFASFGCGFGCEHTKQNKKTCVGHSSKATRVHESSARDVCVCVCCIFTVRLRQTNARLLRELRRLTARCLLAGPRTDRKGKQEEIRKEKRRNCLRDSPQTKKNMTKKTRKIGHRHTENLIYVDNSSSDTWTNCFARARIQQEMKQRKKHAHAVSGLKWCALPLSFLFLCMFVAESVASSH